MTLFNPKSLQRPKTYLNLSDPYQLNLYDHNQLALIIPRDKTASEYLASIILNDGRKPYEYQAENVEFFCSRNNFRGICADDTGLGKTITVCALIQEFADRLLPALIVCKATLRVQWFIELLSACGVVAQIIENSKTPIDPNAQAWIASYDIFSRFDGQEADLKPRLIVFDECQQIKNWNSKRTVALVHFSRGIPYIIATSATPIKNNLGEYFPVLNIISPSTFDSKADFEAMCELRPTSAGTWRLGGVNRHSEERWRELTKNIIIRHKREDVAAHLPKIRRAHRFVKIEAKDAVNKIVAQTKQFLEAYNDYQSKDSGSEKSNTKMRANSCLMSLRHTIGDAKVSFAVDFIQEFMSESEERRLTVFVHHKSVALAIITEVERLIASGELNIAPPFIIRGGMNETERNDLIMRCTSNRGWPTNDPKSRLLIASTLAAGEGINLQKCYDALMVERQFNPPNEEQAEGRFSRQGMEKAVDFINVIYLTAIASIDQWFHNLVESKRRDLKRTHGDKDFYGGEWGDDDMIVTDFMDVVAAESIKMIKRMK